MQIKQLECFVHLAETLNYSKTAETLYTTQPNVTYQIHSLENELGIKLFSRTKKDVKLTPAGESFYHDMKNILTILHVAISKAKKSNMEIISNIAIGYDFWGENNHLGKIISAYQKKLSHVYLYLKMLDYREKCRLFIDNKLDLIFIARESLDALPDHCYLELYTGKFVCVMPKEHPFANKSRIKISEFKNQSIILMEPIKWLKELVRIQDEIQLKGSATTVCFCDCLQAAVMMIKAGIGVSIMPDFAYSEDSNLTAVPTDIEDMLSYGIAWHKYDTRQEIKEFVRLAQEIYCDEK